MLTIIIFKYFKIDIIFSFIILFCIGVFNIIKFILKELSSGKVEEVSYNHNDYFGMFFNSSSEDYTYSFKEPYQQTDSILIVTDLNYNIIYHNPSIINILNIEIDLIDGLNFFDVYPSLNKLSFLKDIDSNNNNQQNFELSIYDNEILIHHFSVSVLKYYSKILMFCIPIPMFQQFEYLMSESLNFGIEPTAIIKDYRIIYANDLFSEITGKSIDNLIGLELYENIDIISVNNNQLADALKNILEDVSFYHEQTFHVNIHGEDKKFKIFASRAHVHNPFIEIVILDVTKENLFKEVAFSVRNNFHLLRSFGEIVSFTQGFMGESLVWSPEFYYIMGYHPSNKSLNDDLFNYIVDEDSARFQQQWLNAIKFKKDLRSGFDIETADGRKHLHIYAKINYSNNGEVLSIQGYIRDITETTFYKKEYEKHLEESKNLARIGYNFTDFNTKLCYDFLDLEYKTFNNPDLVLTRSMKRLKFLNYFNDYVKENTKSAYPFLCSTDIFDMLNNYLNENYDLSFLKFKFQIDSFNLGMIESEILSFIIGGVIIDYSVVLNTKNMGQKRKLKVKLVQNKNHIILTIKGDLSAKAYVCFENTYMKSIELLTTFVNGVFLLKDNINGFTLKVKIPL